MYFKPSTDNGNSRSPHQNCFLCLSKDVLLLLLPNFLFQDKLFHRFKTSRKKTFTTPTPLFSIPKKIKTQRNHYQSWDFSFIISTSTILLSTQRCSLMKSLKRPKAKIKGGHKIPKITRKNNYYNYKKTIKDETIITII